MTLALYLIVQKTRSLQFYCSYHKVYAASEAIISVKQIRGEYITYHVPKDFLFAFVIYSRYFLNVHDSVNK